MTRRKPLIIIACILGVAATVTAELSINTGPLQLPHGYSAQLIESTVLVEHVGHPAHSVPLNWILYGVALVILLYCVAANVFERNRPRGFEVEPPADC